MQNMMAPPNGADEFEPASSSQHLRVAGWLRDRIIEGEFLPGAKIPEVATCDRLGISRTPLREAFKVLAAERILTLQPNRGAIVTPVGLDDIEQAMTVTATLEGLAGELLCDHVTSAEVDRLSILTKELTLHRRAGDLMAYFKVNQEIHRLIIEGSRNRTLIETHEMLSNRFARYRFVGNKSPDRWDRAMLEHELILGAIRDRDSAVIGPLLKSHILNGWRVARGKSFDTTD
ncbi:GntR family transcriptional regulator [Szabonella alba]|uniref:GntR family transcriptional regulator n=1 Tax=Szabonella alba TaxID=2804194 RepID=A0A8K0VDP1_9RHOB|nr:GntR family transcriptional regulator [Szabonella alba]MBL4919191.1 GntR family transcriptional regulator [Szabonella alba]